ncbi:MAG: hypothetical protein QOJ15_2559 [Bradyrhizobium sp.]|jgi:hypothetical protein|nr:hypothetical protein [Bradyrhizobium sp.]
MSAAAAEGSTCNQRGGGWRVPSTGSKASSHRCGSVIKYRNAKPSACVPARSVHAGTRTKPRRKPKSQARCQGSPAMATEQDRPSGRPVSLEQSALCCSRSWRNVQCASRQDVPGAGERGARLGPAATRKAVFCVAPRPAEGGLADGPECAAYFASLICNAGLVTPSSPARILLRGLWLDEIDRRPGFKSGLLPTRTLPPNPGFGAPSSSCNRTDMSAKHI